MVPAEWACKTFQLAAWAAGRDQVNGFRHERDTIDLSLSAWVTSFRHGSDDEDLQNNKSPFIR